jgi:uncharacterized membrane protein
LTTKTAFIWVLVLVAIMFGVGLYSYPRLGDQVITHWNAQGQPNGYGSRFAGAFFLPLMALGLGLILLGLPEIDPLKKNIQLFRKDYNGFVVALVGFFLYLHVVTILINLGAPLNINRMLVPGMGIFLYYAGVLIGKSRRNFFIGIRTPWTLSSDTVWEKTHRLGGVLFRGVGIITLLGFFFPEYAIWLMIVPLMIVAVFVTAYSYFEYRYENPSNS